MKTKAKLVSFLKKLLFTAAGCVLLFGLLNFFFPLPDKIEYATIVTDNRGELLHAYLTPDQKWRMKTELEEISPLLRKTIIEKEDRYFYSHPGFNPFAIAKAFARNLFRMKRVSGASTITMQVARALEPKKRNYLNKLAEVFRAVQLELHYSKDEILTLYMNLLPYGSNIEGVKAASWLYFKKSPDHLSLAEITALSVIPNRPSSLVIGKHNELIVRERNRWLRKFAADQLFTQKEIQDALQEPLIATRGAVPQLLPHLSYKLKKRGQPVIRTTINLNTQLTIEKLVGDYVRSIRYQGIKNAAAVVINNKTGQVVGYVGSADFRDTTDGGQVNGAAAIRQPGSTLKPLLYGLCIDEGLMTPKMVLTDLPVVYDGYAPENYDRKFSGYVTMEYALEHSLNIPAVKSLRQLGVEKMVARLASCNFEQVKKDGSKLGLSMILGGCGASLEELTGLYALFAHNGTYIQPAYLLSEPAHRKVQVMSPAAAYMINETLSKLNRPDFPLNWQSTEHMPKIAWKTGTSYGKRDAWSIGYNNNFTVGIWVGNFSGAGVAELSGAGTATPLLFKIFNTIDYDSDLEWFQQPAGCSIRTVCSETGLLPSEHCTRLQTDYFIPLVSSSKPCSREQEILVSEDEKISYCRNCQPERGYKKKLYTIVSPEMQTYFAENRIPYQKIPPHDPGCDKIFKEGAPTILFPSKDAEYLISKKDPEPLQLVCQAGSDVSKIYWYINNRFYKATPAGTKQFFMPEEGPVKISCTDDKGRNKDIWIRVRWVDL
ncbi:MAG: penicillin-binding protein 1C [Williamsia sp.]|nr:penicillin-binding protein 1C [Williamsia sp.]